MAEQRLGRRRRDRADPQLDRGPVGNELGDVSTLREPGVMDDLAEKVREQGDDEDGE